MSKLRMLFAGMILRGEHVRPLDEGNPDIKLNIVDGGRCRSRTSLATLF